MSTVKMSRLGDALRKQANDNQRVISYNPSWNRETGSVTATILLQQISFRFENNGDKPFYKFKEPCTHAAYKKGDSWTEELGFTRREFDTALENIGQKINKETPRQPDKLVWYWTNTDRLTRYELNVKAFDEMLERIYVKAESAFTESAKAPLLISEITTENKNYNNLLTPNGDSPVADEIDTHLLNGKIFPSMELVPSSETPSKIAPKVSPPAAAAKNPAYQECFRAFNDLKQEHEGVPGKKVIINGKETGQNINKWLAAGYTAAELTTVFVALKQDGWRTNALNMATIVKEGANILRRKTGGKGKGLGLTGLQRWLQENYGVTDLETAAMVAEKTEQELLDDHAFYA